MDQPPSGRWPALIAAMTASRLSSFNPIRKIAAAAPPVANAWPGPSPKVPSGFRMAWICSFHRGKSGELACDGLQPGDRHPDLLEALGVLAEVVDRLLDHRRVGDLELGGGHQADGRGGDVGLAARASERTRRPASRHDLTYLTQPRTSGTEPPTC